MNKIVNTKYLINKQAMQITALLAFLILMSVTGCTKIVLMDNEGARELKDEKVARLVRPSRLTGVVVRAGEDGAQPLPTDTIIETEFDVPVFRVAFDSLTGVVDVEKQQVYATDLAGNKRVFEADQLIWMRFKKQGYGSRFINADLAFYSMAKKDNVKFDDTDFLKEACWELIVFDRNGGQVNPVTGTIDGVTNAGMVVSADLDEVRYVAFDLGRPPLYLLRGSAILFVAYWLAQGWKDVMND